MYSLLYVRTRIIFFCFPLRLHCTGDLYVGNVFSISSSIWYLLHSIFQLSSVVYFQFLLLLIVFQETQKAGLALQGVLTAYLVLFQNT